MKIGFTGTRTSLTVKQHHALCEWLKEHVVTEFHHGCCIGADAEADEAVMALQPKAARHAHPPMKRGWFSENALLFANVKHPPKDFLDRNRDIVDATDILLACPDGDEEIVRSGTWSTIRYAKRLKRPVVIFWHDGSVDEARE